MVLEALHANCIETKCLGRISNDFEKFQNQAGNKCYSFAKSRGIFHGIYVGMCLYAQFRKEKLGIISIFEH